MPPEESRVGLSPFYAVEGTLAGCLLSFHISEHKTVSPLTDLAGSKSGLPRILPVKVINHLLSRSFGRLTLSSMD